MENVELHPFQKNLIIHYYGHTAFLNAEKVKVKH